MKFLFGLIFICMGFAQNIETILISHNNRIKPLQTFYNEGVTLIYGRSVTKLDNIKRSASETVRYIYEDSKDLEEEFIFRIDHPQVKASVGLEASKKFFSYKEIRGSIKLRNAITEAIRKARNELPMSELEDGYIQINSQLNRFSELFNLHEYKIVPRASGEWITVYESMQQGFPFKFKSGYSGLLNSVRVYQDEILSEGQLAKRSYELLYNSSHPFLYSWIVLLISTFLAGLSLKNNRTRLHLASKITFLAGFLLIVFGFTLRVFISGRAPVTNMYESVVWVGFAAATLSLFQYFSKTEANKKLIPFSTGAAAFAVMACDLLPNVFDAGISPLQPVLRSNFWLTTHVLTITFSYGAFAVSFVISLVALFQFVVHKKAFQKSLESANYSALKIGTLFLAIGTLLGAVWADVAWGRFWGWDPKETWAAITLLVYMILLHGRFAGWIKRELNYVYSVFGFLSVMMAWYGVNYILGVGLHSYGFSKAGNSWFFYTAGILTVFSIFAVIRYRKSSETKNSKGARHAAKITLQ